MDHLVMKNKVKILCSFSEPASGKADVYLICRLSTTGNDVKLAVRLTDPIKTAKRRLQASQGVEYEPSTQRWYYGGKLLTDSTTVDEAKIPAGHVVQVVVNLPSSPPQTMEMSKIGRRTTSSHGLGLESGTAHQGSSAGCASDMTQVES
jgi:hypothetical protein